MANDRRKGVVESSSDTRQKPRHPLFGRPIGMADPNHAEGYLEANVEVASSCGFHDNKIFG